MSSAALWTSHAHGRSETLVLSADFLPAVVTRDDIYQDPFGADDLTRGLEVEAHVFQGGYVIGNLFADLGQGPDTVPTRLVSAAGLLLCRG